MYRFYYIEGRIIYVRNYEKASRAKIFELELKKHGILYMVWNKNEFDMDWYLLRPDKDHHEYLYACINDGYPIQVEYQYCQTCEESIPHDRLTCQDCQDAEFHKKVITKS